MSKRLRIALAGAMFAFMAVMASTGWFLRWAAANDPIPIGMSPEDAKALRDGMFTSLIFLTIGTIVAAVALHGAITGWASNVIRISPKA